MNEKIEMEISPITHDNAGKPQVFILFKDGAKSAEGRIPGCSIISNEGFSDEDIKILEQYLKAEKAAILTQAKKLDVMKAFLGEWNK